MAKANFYVKAKKNKVSGFLGPFEDKTIAEEIAEKVQAEVGNAQVLPKTKARAEGLRSPEMGDTQNTLLGTDVSVLDILETLIDNSKSNKPNNNGKKRKYTRKENKMNTVIEDKVIDDAQIVSEFENSEAIVITKYLSNIEWLREHGVAGPVVTKANPHEITGKAIVGIVPYRLGSLAKKVGIIDLPRLRADMVGKMLNTEDLYEAGAQLRWFKVVELDRDWERVFNFLEDEKNFQKVLSLSK